VAVHDRVLYRILHAISFSPLDEESGWRPYRIVGSNIRRSYSGSSHPAG